MKWGITEEFIDREWDDYKRLGLVGVELVEYTETYRLAKKWAESVLNKKYDLGLFLHGSNGCGKSSLGCLLLKDFMSASIPVYRISMMKVQKSFFDGWAVPDICLSQVVLFLEGVGKEYKTKAEHSEIVLEYILKYRAERKLPTIVSTNAKMKDIAIRYGKTVESVLKGCYYPINFPAMDLRQLSVGRKIKNMLGEEV